MNDSTAEFTGQHRARAGSSSSAPSPSPSQPQQLPSLPTRRTKISCLPCRTRKSKCDHARPCSSCVLRGTAKSCADPNGAAPTASASSTSSAMTRAPSSATGMPTSKTRPLPASMSMPSLSEHTSQNAAHDNRRANGSQPQKRKRTEAPSSVLSESESIYSDIRYPHPGPLQVNAASERDINDEVHQMKRALARLEDLLHRRSTSSSSSHVSGPSISTQQSHSTSAIYEYQLDPHQDCPGEQNPPSAESRQRWDRLRSILPPLIDTHIMMHYVFVEGDWLMYTLQAPRFVARWKHAYERQAIEDIFAVQVLAVVALSAVFLSGNHQRSIQFAVPLRLLHPKLIKQARNMIDDMPIARTGSTEAEACDLIEINLLISFYFRVIGKELLTGQYTERAVASSKRHGLDNELRPSWFGLTPSQVERRRTIMAEVILSAKWDAFHCRKDLDRLRVQSFNVGLPHLETTFQLPPLSAWPQSEDLARAAAVHSLNALSSRFFAWRTKSDQERRVASRYTLILTSLTNELPPLVELVAKTEARLLQPEALAQCTKDQMKDMARQTRQILARIQEWFTLILPQAGFGYERVVHANTTSADPVEDKTLDAVLLLNHSVFYMHAIVCRAWLLLSDRLESLADARREDPNAHEQPTMVNQAFMDNLKHRTFEQVQFMHASWLPSTFLADIKAAVLENARRCIQSIPTVRALQSHSTSHFSVVLACQSFLQVAVNLAVPLVRSHQRLRYGATQRSHNQGDRDMEPERFGESNTDELRHYIVTIVEAVSQLSDHVVARRTAQVLNRAMRFGEMETPYASHQVNGDDVDDAWEAEEICNNVPGQMQNAAEGLAMLSAASASSANTPTDGGTTTLATQAWETGPRAFPASSHHHLVPYHDGPASTPYRASNASVPIAPNRDGSSREPMWWEARYPIDASQHSTNNLSGENGGGNTGLVGQPLQQPIMSDSQLLGELLNLDPAFWQFVVDGSGIATGSAS